MTFGPIDQVKKHHRDQWIIEFSEPGDEDAAIDNMESSVVQQRVLWIKKYTQDSSSQLLDSKQAVWHQQEYLETTGETTAAE